MTIYYQDDLVTLHHGQAADVLSTMPDQSIDCVVTSPPYFGLRDYGVDGQIGAEQTPAAFVEALRSVFAEARRVLADDGTCWLNLGDSYQSTGGKTGVGPNAKVGSTKRQEFARTRPKSEFPNKNLLGIPWRVAFALQDDGWILRNAIVWSKPNAMPESVTDRLSTRYEMLFLLTKSRRYWFDLDPIREAHSALTQMEHRAKTPHSQSGKNPGDVWTIPTTPFPGAHFAVFPPEIPRRCIAAGCKPGGTVLDPFHGSGTTGMVAQKLGHPYVGIDLNAEYLDLSLRTRLKDAALPFGDAS